MISIPYVITLLVLVLLNYPTSCESLKCDGCSRQAVISKAASEENGSSLSCYDCSAHNPDCGVSTATLVQGCQSCMIYLNTFDSNNVIRRCCTSGCGSPDTIGEFDGRKTYFCSSNQCNGIGAEKELMTEAGIQSTTTKSTTLSSTQTTTSTTTTIQTSFSCYDCSDTNAQQCTSMSSNCPMCMIYRNDNDPTKFDRRCCWWGCGTPNQVSNYNGRPTYFCNANKCNGPGSEAILGYAATTSSNTTMIPSTTTTKAITTTTIATTTAQTSSQCYDCSGPECGRDSSSTSNCPKCMVYRNPSDQTKIERRCCWWECGPSNSVSTYNGLETYFCTGNKCNGYGTEFALKPPVVTTTAITTTRMTTTIVTTATTTTTIATTTEPTSSQCYDCSGPECGRDGSSTSNCPKCMVYRNPSDQTKIERRCCWWGCGPSNSVSTYNGLETYFCTGNKCNGYGTEFALKPPVTTTTVTMITTTMISTTTLTTTATTSSAASCVLNCQNGGTPETEDGCFCYCLDNTNGRECENVDCIESNVDSETCSLENQSLCEESETFTYECLHLCGKC